MNGKGQLCFKNGNIIYDGEWVDGKIEGYGTHYYGDGTYYIGQFKNNDKNGKGKLYNKNIIKMEILHMMEIGLMEKKKEKDNYIIKMEILYMMEI